MPKSSKAAARHERQSQRRDHHNHEALIAKAIEDQTRTEKRKAISSPVTPLTDGQRRYDAAIRSSSIIFGVGPAGTGKTWFAIQRAAQALKERQIEKIIVTRPAVEVERSMGYMPGDLNEKFAPYLRPVADAFIDAFGQTHYEYLLKSGRIEALPLAFMRGATVKNAWLVADEMQNATDTEFKMMLTRIGENAKFIINGDASQIDRGICSGLENAIRITSRLDDVSTIRFSSDEIVRSGLCQQIVEAYENISVTPRSDLTITSCESDVAGLERFLRCDSERNGNAGSANGDRASFAA